MGICPVKVSTPCADNFPMKYLIIFMLFSRPIWGQVNETESTSLKHYVSCHKKLDEEIKLNPEKFQSDECDTSLAENDFDDFKEVVDHLNHKNYLKYASREKNLKNREMQEFLERCLQETSDFHSKVGSLALEAYDISFLDRKNPVLENVRGGLPPEGYKVSKFYGHNPESCYQTGFKGALFASEDGKHVVFSITGTEGSSKYSSGKERETYLSQKSGMLGFGSKKTVVVSANDKDKEDWFPITGSKQFSTSCAQQMIEDAVKVATQEGKRIVFTGHSLGGALAQALSYRTQEELLKEKEDYPPVEVVTFMGVGGRKLVGSYDQKKADIMNSTSYVSLGDIVSGFGVQVGEMRELIRKPDYEEKFKSKELGLLDTHTLKLDHCEPLGDSIHISAVQRNQRCSAYFQEINKPNETTK